MSGVCTDVKIKFYNNSPVVLEFQLLRETTPRGKLFYLLAPRVEEETEQGEDMEIPPSEDENTEPPSDTGEEEGPGESEE